MKMPKNNLKDLDIGFRVLKVCEKIQPKVDEERFLYQVFLVIGFPLHTKYEYKEYENIKYFECINPFNQFKMYACFSDCLNDNIIQFILEDKPRHLVLRNIAYSNNRLNEMKQKYWNHILVEWIKG
jgi:hypothetical protein